MKRRIRLWDWLLIMGACMAPMTGMRIWKIGPAELLCFVWGLRYFPKRVYRFNDVSRFFLVFLGSMLIGTGICLLVARSELSMADWATWIFLTFIALAIYEGVSRNALAYNEKLLYAISVCSVLWYLFLFLYSRLVSATFLGAPLWYNRVRYSGGGTNPHQLAVLMCGVILCLARSFFQKRHRLLSAACMAGAIFIELQTKSSTGLLSIFLGFMVLAVLLTFYRVKSKKSRTIIILLEIAAAVLVLMFGAPFIYRYAYNWVAEDPNGLGRFYIFSSIKGAFLKSPIFGLGPGMHALDPLGLKEFHNTYLEILAATGIVGSFSFILLSVRAVRKLFADKTLLPIMVAIYAYGLAGFAMRRLAYWTLFIFILVIAEQISANGKMRITGEILC